MTITLDEPEKIDNKNQSPKLKKPLAAENEKSKNKKLLWLLLLLLLGSLSFLAFYFLSSAKKNAISPEPVPAPVSEIAVPANVPAENVTTPAPISDEAPTVTPSVETVAAPASVPSVESKRPWWGIYFFPIFVKTSNATCAIFPLYCNVQNEERTQKTVWFLTYYKLVREQSVQSGIFPFYDTRKTYTPTGELAEKSRRIFFVKV